MTVHLVKLCVGIVSMQELAEWQVERLRNLKRRGAEPELMHVTRQMPRRAAEILDGGSLYWVIKGRICVRHRILELRPVVKNGVPHCGIVYDPKPVATVRWPREPFQGWRYLRPQDAPPDARALKGGNLPEALKLELAELGLL